MTNLIYLGSALTSFVCFVLLVRAYRATRSNLLFWAAWCFAGLALNNLLVLIDERIIATTDLSVWRTLPALMGVGAMLYGLIWRVE